MDTSIKLNDEYYGVVAENDDPQKDRRLKVRIEPLHGDIPTSDLPWAIPSDSSGLATGGSEGTSTDYGNGGVPYKGSKVKVEFEDGDPQDPKWMGPVQDKQQAPKRFRGEEDKAYDEMDSNTAGPETGPGLPEYPDGRGFVLKNGSVFELSDDGRFLVYANGFRLETTSDGLVVQHANDNFEDIVVKDRTEYTGGDSTEEVSGDKQITAGSWTVEVGGVSIEVSDGTVSIGGGSVEALVKESVKSVLNNHTHIGNLGAPTSSPVTPIVQTINLTRKTEAS